MSLRIRPIASDYDPGYPAMVEIDDWQALLADSSRAVFDARTLAFAGLLGASMLIPAPSSAAVPETLTAGNPTAAAIANTALAEVKGRAMWRKVASVGTRAYVKGNPDITVPRIPISFGNSMIGVFDMKRARAVTVDIFRAYGVELQTDYPLKREDLAFHVDGYDPERGIGFEIVGGERPPMGFSGRKPGPAPPAHVQLDEDEQKRLMSAVEGKALKLLLVPVDGYPNMDGDQYTPLAAYLRSVLDYLDWLKANGHL